MVTMIHAYSIIFYKLLAIMYFYFNIMHKSMSNKSMSNFAYKYEIKKISYTEVRLGFHSFVTLLTKYLIL